MRLVKRLRRADRHAYAMQRNRMVATDGFEGAMGRSTGAHVVFGMDFEKAALRPLREDRGQMLVLETGSSKPVDWMPKAEKHCCGRNEFVRSVHRASPLLAIIAGACCRIRSASANHACRSAARCWCRFRLERTSMHCIG